jgi:predicted alpha/beta superfamily hydrolase
LTTSDGIRAARAAPYFATLGDEWFTILPNVTEAVIANDQAPIPQRGLALRLHKHEAFASKLVDEHHDLLVYLPPMYKTQPGRRFSVLYMQDGQNLFDPETSFIKGNYWRMGETADALIEDDLIEPLIIVGIYNTGDSRIDEYTPVEDRRLGGGQADAYGRMLVEELKPFIDAQYRTLQGAEYCGMGGSSLGGLVTLYLGLQYPAVFSRLAVMSPSVWWRNRAILSTVAALPQRPELRIWLDIGTKESTRALPDARLLRDRLVSKGWKLGESLAYLEAEDAAHTESAWAERVSPMLQFLFPAKEYAETQLL